MKIIKLKDEYPWCHTDECIEVSDEVAAVFDEAFKEEGKFKGKQDIHNIIIVMF